MSLTEYVPSDSPLLPAGMRAAQWYPSLAGRPFPRLLAFDLDGTLLATGAVLTRRTVAAVAAAARHATIVLATGGFSARTHLIADILAREAGAPTWRVAHNGGAIWSPDGALLHADPTPPAAVHAVLAATGRRVWAAFETVDTGGAARAYYAGRLRPELNPFIWGPQTPPQDDAGIHTGLEPRWDWRRTRRAAAAPHERVLGCWCIGSDTALAPLDAQARGQQLHGARYLPWGRRLGQILGRPRLRLEGRDIGARSASKGAAVARIATQVGVAPLQIAAFGDSDNDVDMLALAGTGVAMGNATQNARDCAIFVAPNCDEDGVAQVLEAWLDSI